jgi:signal transduction histidine kinase
LNPLISCGLVTRELRHDIRNQLSALRTTLAVLEQHLDAPQRVARSLHACTGVLERLTAEIQEYFALQTGERAPTECEFDRLVADALQTVAAPAASLGIAIDFSRPQPVTINSRPVLVMMALRHLVRALMRLASRQISLTITAPENNVVLAINYTERPHLAAQIREEVNDDLAAARECLALCDGSLALAHARMTVALPTASAD